ncbi:MAG: DUF421 domain-containing protein [Erysipelotrichales bacterium]|nr:DUF421 domain-containing protein [Erysipelotrichales bacterium]
MKYVEIFLECIVAYFYLVAALRFLGKKEMSQLTISDLIVFLLISELMTISIGDNNVNFLQGAIAVLSIVVLDKLCSYLSLKYKAVKKLLEGHPTYIIYQGKLNKEKMMALNYSIDDLCHHLREQGIGTLSQVEFAVLETDGNLSIIEKGENEVYVPETLISDGVINDDILKTMNKDRKWLFDLLKKDGIDDYKNIFYCVLEKDKLFYIKR